MVILIKVISYGILFGMKGNDLKCPIEVTKEHEI